MARDPEGRNIVQMQERVRRASAPLGERGRTGTQIFGGFISTEEYVPELTGLTGLRTLDRMRRSDGMIKAVIRALIQPLLAANWAVDPASEEQKDQDVAEEIEEGLFEGMSSAWADVLRQILTFLPLGFAVFEKVWEVRDVQGEKKVMPRKLAPRLQTTIFKFNTADDGGLDSLTQQAYSNEGFLNVDIDIDRLLVFVNEKEGADWKGMSIIRPAYKHWWIKDTLYRIQAMAAERWGVGIPTLELPPDHSEDEDVRKAENILSAMRSHERAYAAWPAGYIFKLITSSSQGGSMMDLQPMIDHHNRMIAVSVLAQFLTLGTTDVGSWALSNDQSALFLMVEQAIGDYVCDIFNRHLIPQWCDYNYSDLPNGYPKLRVKDIETRNIEKLLVGMAAAAQAGLFTPDPDLEDALREGMGFPPLPRDANGQPIVPDNTAGPLPPGVMDTQPGLGGPPGPPQPGVGAPPVGAGAATNPAAPRGPQPAAAPAPKLNALDETAPNAVLPSVGPAKSYPEENAQIAHNKQTPQGKKPHPFIPARYTHTNGHPRCLMCGAEPLQGDPLHTEYPPEVANFAWLPKRPLRGPEAHVDFEAMDSALNEARAKIRDGAATPVQRIIRSLAERAARAVQSGDTSQLQADALKIDAADLEDAIKAQLDDLYRFGAEQVRGEIRSQVSSLRGAQQASLEREAAVIEAYRQSFEGLRQSLRENKGETERGLSEIVAALAQRPIVVAGSGGGKARWKTVINKETGVIEGLEREEE